jgi:hypothetical protein
MKEVAQLLLGRLVRRTADSRFFARLAITSPVNCFGNACPGDQCCVRPKVPIGLGHARSNEKRIRAANPDHVGRSVASSAQRGHDRGGSKSRYSLTATTGTVQSTPPTPLRNQQQSWRLAAHSRCGCTIGNRTPPPGPLPPGRRRFPMTWLE